jgi:hypothetical protein
VPSDGPADSFRQFAWLWFKTAFPPAWAWADGASGAIGLGALYLVKRYPEFEQLMTDLGWQVPLALFSAILLGRLVAAPFSIYSAQRRELSNLREQIQNLTTRLEVRRNNQELADALTGLFRRGVVEILNSPPADREDLPRWRNAAAIWLSDALSIMLTHDCTPQDLNHVEIVGIVQTFMHHPDPEIAKALSEFAIRLGRVADVSTKYAQ